MSTLTTPPASPCTRSSGSRWKAPTAASLSGMASTWTPIPWPVSSPECPVGLAYPPDQEDQARQGDAEAEKRDPALKAVERIPQGVEHDGGQESRDHPPVQDCAASLEPLPPQDGAYQARPGRVPGRRHQAADEQHLVERTEAAFGLEEGNERVAHRLQGGEAHRRCHAEQ